MGVRFMKGPFRVFIDMIKNVMLAIFACVLNSSSCTANITPMAYDNPPVCADRICRFHSAGDLFNKQTEQDRKDNL